MGNMGWMAELLLEEQMMHRSQSWLGCFVVLSVCTHPLAYAQKAERPRGAEVASFFFNTASIATGVVSRLLVNPFGEVDGLLLESGKQMPHIAEIGVYDEPG